MDNKQAIEHLRNISIYNNLKHWEDNAIDKAITSLEAWDKVIEEIERQYQINRRVLHVDYYNVGIEQALEIINKHLV